MAFADGSLAADKTHHARIQRSVSPPCTAVRDVKGVLARTNVMVGVQNMHRTDDDAWGFWGHDGSGDEGRGLGRKRTRRHLAGMFGAAVKARAFLRAAK